MFKMSVLWKLTALAVLVALVLASFPTNSVFAGGDKPALEKKWEQLVDNYNKQSINHNSAHQWVEHWLKTHKKASDAKKAEIQKHLNICNSALAASEVIVTKHAGFDAKGKIVDRASAIKSIKDLSYYLREHAASVNNLDKHVAE